MIVVVTAAQADEYATREIARSVALDGPEAPNPYAKIHGRGRYDMSEAEVRELLDDARQYLALGGPAQGNPGLTSLYFGVARRCRAALATAAEVEAMLARQKATHGDDPFAGLPEGPRGL